MSESSNIGSLQGILEIKNENNLLKSQNISETVDKNIKEEKNIEEDKNTKINSARKEENKTNLSIGSENS